MQDSHYSRDSGSNGFRKEEAGSNRTRSPSHGKKLKNESSAKRAEGAKFRQDKADHVLNAEEKKELLKHRKAHQKAARKEFLETKAAHDAVDSANEDENAGTEALNRGTEAVETGARVAGNSIYGNKLKSVTERQAKASGEPEAGVFGAGKSDSGGYAAGQSKSSYAARMGSTAREAAGKAARAQENVAAGGKAAQHQFMKKEFQRVASQKSTAEAANSFGSLSRKFTDRAEDIVGKIGEWISEHLSEHALAVLVLVTILIVVMIIGGGASSGHLISNLFGDSAIASSYTAEDEDIKAVNQDYKDLEAGLQKHHR
jgi:hypothetical protein